MCSPSSGAARVWKCSGPRDDRKGSDAYGDVPITGPLIIPGVDTIDVTAVSTDALGLNHSGYAENPALLNDVKALVEFGLRPPDKRIKNVLTVESEAGTFWRFQVAK